MAKKTWGFCKKNGLDCTEELHENVQEGAIENDEAVKLLGDITIQCDNVTEVRKLDNVQVTDKKEYQRIIIDIAVPADVRIGGKETDRVKNNQK